MKCNECRELLSLYIDQMLDESQTKEIEEHLSVCETCRKEYNELREMVDLLGQSEMIPIPDAFNFRLKKALKEEKQSMLEAGILGKLVKKKSKWRMLTSVAAVFAVGVLSFGLYKDVLGILPDKLNGGDQTGTAQVEEPYIQESNDPVSDSNIASDGSIMMKEQVSDLPPVENEIDKAGSDEMLRYSAESSADAKEVPRTISGLADSAEPNTDYEYGAEADVADIMTEQENSDECSRSLTTSGVERNAAAIQYYDNLIEEKLNGFDYQVLDYSFATTGEWQFRVFIFRGKDGNTYNEEILIMGKDGEIEVICSNEFMGL